MHARVTVLLEDGTTASSRLAPLCAFARGVALPRRRAAVHFRVSLVACCAVVNVLGPFPAKTGTARLGPYVVRAELTHRRATLSVYGTSTRTLAHVVSRDERTRRRAETLVARWLPDAPASVRSLVVRHVLADW